MVSIYGRSSNMLLTPNHRCIVLRRDSRKHCLRPPTFVRADELRGGMKFPVAAQLSDDGLLLPHDPPEFYELLGWVLSEGCFSDTGGISLSQSLTANPGHTCRLNMLAMYFHPDMKKSERVRMYKGRPNPVVEYSII